MLHEPRTWRAEAALRAGKGPEDLERGPGRAIQEASPCRGALGPGLKATALSASMPASPPRPVRSSWPGSRHRADKIFTEARRSGRCEPSQAYMADALVSLVTKSGGSVPTGPKALAHLRVDIAALRRGNTEPGEMCEIAGVGPVSVAIARELLGDSIAKVLVTSATDVHSICNLGRAVPARLHSALVERDRCCVVPGCSSTYNLEIDHRVVPFANGGADRAREPRSNLSPPPLLEDIRGLLARRRARGLGVGAPRRHPPASERRGTATWKGTTGREQTGWRRATTPGKRRPRVPTPPSASHPSATSASHPSASHPSASHPSSAGRTNQAGQPSQASPACSAPSTGTASGAAA